MPQLTPTLTFTLASWSGVWMFLGMAAFLFIGALMMLVVLIQKPQGGGLAGAFGSGAGSGQTAFGTKTGDALTVATIGFFVIWLLGAIGLNFAIKPPAPAPAAITAPASPAAPETPPGPAPSPGTAPAPATTSAPAPQP
jgi:preprotein translocase subunit SecG